MAANSQEVAAQVAAAPAPDAPVVNAVSRAAVAPAVNVAPVQTPPTAFSLIMEGFFAQKGSLFTSKQENQVRYVEGLSKEEQEKFYQEMEALAQNILTITIPRNIQREAENQNIPRSVRQGLVYKYFEEKNKDKLKRSITKKTLLTAYLQCLLKLTTQNLNERILEDIIEVFKEVTEVSPNDTPTKLSIRVSLQQLKASLSAAERAEAARRTEDARWAARVAAAATLTATAPADTRAVDLVSVRQTAATNVINNVIPEVFPAAADAAHAQTPIDPVDAVVAAFVANRLAMMALTSEQQSEARRRMGGPAQPANAQAAPAATTTTAAQAAPVPAPTFTALRNARVATSRATVEAATAPAASLLEYAASTAAPPALANAALAADVAPADTPCEREVCCK